MNAHMRQDWGILLKPNLLNHLAETEYVLVGVRHERVGHEIRHIGQGFRAWREKQTQKPLKPAARKNRQVRIGSVQWFWFLPQGVPKEGFAILGWDLGPDNSNHMQRRNMVLR
jgi:hypothetical protein